MPLQPCSMSRRGLLKQEMEACWETMNPVKLMKLTLSTYRSPYRPNNVHADRIHPQALLDPGEVPFQGVDIRRTHPATGGRPGPTRFNQVVYNSGFLFLAGQIVDDTSAPGMDSYYGQTKQVLHQVGQLLEASGSSMQRILQARHLQPTSPACYTPQPA